MLISGYFFICVGIGLYVLCLATQCFTFNFNRPFFKSFKSKLYVINILVQTPIGLGAAFFLEMILLPILDGLGLPFSISFAIPLLTALIVTQMLFICIDIWKPLESIVVKRLSAYGVRREDLERGIYVGISDPDKSSFKKMTLVEEDLGMLWIEPDELRYAGDTDHFRIGREQFIELQRAVDKGSVSAYFGNVAVIVRFLTPEGTERRVRLHPESSWTMPGRAKLSEQLAEEILEWQQQSEPIYQPG